MGFDCDRFLPGTVTKLVRCPICKNVYDNPIITRCCGINTCLTCAPGNTCPECDQPLEGLWFHEVLRNVVLALKLCCQFENCAEYHTVQDISAHEDHCAHTPTRCWFTGCDTILPLADLVAHQEECVFGLAPCLHNCGATLTLGQVATHQCVTELRQHMTQVTAQLQTEIDRLEKIVKTLTERL